jgi:uncharacterized membrane protein
MGRFLAFYKGILLKIKRQNSIMIHFPRNLMIFLAILTATLIPISFFLAPTQGILADKSKTLLANQLYMDSFYVHVILGGIALLIGWIGFIDKIRIKYQNFHRIIGRIYVICFLITAITSILVSYHASGGKVSQWGFMGIGIIAVFTTIKGFLAILNKEIEEHQAWMRYSYACCLASVTLRLWNPLLGLFINDFELMYQIVAWLSWIPNLLYVKLYLNKK